MVLDTAVVGAGMVSQAHLSGLEKCPHTSLEAVCDLDEDRAQRVADEYGIDAYFDATEMIAEADLDWAHICTPVRSHLPIAREAFEAGVPVLIEKPVTDTVAEFEELVAASEEHDTPFSVVHQHLYDPAMRTAREKLGQGALGQVKGVELVFSGLTTPDEPNRGSWAFDFPGGEFEEGLPHPLYLAIAAAGRPASADAISARTSRHGEYGGEFAYDCAQVQYTSEAGTLCTVTMLSGGVPQRLLRIHGEERTLVVDFVSQTVVDLSRNYTSSAVTRVLNNVEHAAGRAKGTVENLYRVAREAVDDEWVAERNIRPHYYQFDVEARALQNGTPRTDAVERARWTITALEAIREAGDDAEEAAPVDGDAAVSAQTTDD